MTIIQLLAGLGGIAVGLLIGSLLITYVYPYRPHSVMPSAPTYRALEQRHNNLVVQQQTMSEEQYKVLANAISDVALGDIGGRLNQY